MVDDEWEVGPKASHFSPRAFLIGNWPYLRHAGSCPFWSRPYEHCARGDDELLDCRCALLRRICVITRWRDVEGKAPHWRLIKTVALHWLAVLVAMYLVFVSDVKQMMNSDASALVLLTVLALGTFTAGVHVAAWRICLVGVVLALAVPAIAWLEEATLLLLLVATALVAIFVLYFMYKRQDQGY